MIKVESRPFVATTVEGVEITLDWTVFERKYWWNKWNAVRSFQQRETALSYARLLRYPTVVNL